MLTELSLIYYLFPTVVVISPQQWHCVTKAIVTEVGFIGSCPFPLRNHPPSTALILLDCTPSIAQRASKGWLQTKIGLGSCAPIDVLLFNRAELRRRCFNSGDRGRNGGGECTSSKGGGGDMVWGRFCVSSHNNNHWRRNGGTSWPATKSMALLDNLSQHIFPGRNSLLPRQYHFQGWKPTNSSGHLVHFIDCKGVMILLEHRGSWNPRMTTQFTDRRASKMHQDVEK